MIAQKLIAEKGLVLAEARIAIEAAHEDSSFVCAAGELACANPLGRALAAQTAAFLLPTGHELLFAVLPVSDDSMMRHSQA